MKKGLLSRLLVVGTSTIALASSIAALTLSWFMVPGGSTNKETLDGMVGLRSYFYDGNGTYEKPFEIVSPIHFYNLTRLQNLGVFSLEKTYFRIGHEFNSSIGPQCINTINNETTYDPGFYTNEMGTFLSVKHPMKIYVGARVAQMLVWKSTREAKKYNGQWQGTGVLNGKH